MTIPLLTLCFARQGALSLPGRPLLSAEGVAETFWGEEGVTAARRAWMPSFAGAARGDAGSRPPALLKRRRVGVGGA